MTIYWLFLKISLLRFDQKSLTSYVREVLVDQKALLSSQDMDEIEALCKVTYGSTKLSLAFLVGNKIGNLLLAVSLVLLVLLPSLLIYGLLYYFGRPYLTDQMIQIAGMGMIPVLAALFAVNGISYVSQPRKELGNLRWLMILILAIGVFAVLNVQVAIGLAAMFLLFLCFFKGGEAK